MAKSTPCAHPKTWGSVGGQSCRTLIVRLLVPTPQTLAHTTKTKSMNMGGSMIAPPPSPPPPFSHSDVPSIRKQFRAIPLTMFTLSGWNYRSIKMASSLLLSGFHSATPFCPDSSIFVNNLSISPSSSSVYTPLSFFCISFSFFLFVLGKNLKNQTL